MELHGVTLVVASLLAWFFGFIYFAALLKQTLLKAMRRSSVLEISNKTISAIQSLIVAYSGMVIVQNTRDNVLHNKHPWTNQIMLMGVGYQLYDLWSMYYVFHAKAEDEQRSDVLRDGLLKKIWKFIRTRPAMVAHHLWFIVIAFPSTLWLRKGLGDFFVGCLYLLDSSTPFVCLRAILSEIGATSGHLYVFNGLAMMVVFFVCRICIFPFMFYAYSNYANISTISVPFYIPKKCVCSCVFMFGLQVYWWSLMLKGAKKAIIRKYGSN